MKPHVIRVLQGEYETGTDFAAPPVVLDIGANVGAFALWAMKRWPGAQVTCYEPHPENLAMLWRNVGEHCRLQWGAVGGSAAERVLLLDGLHNCGEASTKNIGEQEGPGLPVPALRASSLPKCDVAKLDTEGAELDILVAWTEDMPELLLLEAHGEKDHGELTALLVSRDYKLIKETQTMPHRWTMGFRREQ